MIPVVKQSVILRGFETHPLLLPETNSHSLFVGFVLLLKGETRTEHESGESTSNSLSNVILLATLEEHGVTVSFSFHFTYIQHQVAQLKLTFYYIPCSTP